MNKLVSKNLSTQFARQVSSPREKRVEGVPVIHLDRIRVERRVSKGAYLSQHMEVKLWMEECILAWIVGMSRPVVSRNDKKTHLGLLLF